MAEAIDQLVGQYESRQLTRRKLVQSLAALAAGSRTMSAAHPSPFRGVSHNHASHPVSDGLEPSFNRGVEVYFRDPDDTLVQLSAADYQG